jgi:phosphotriesterase-related protein
MLKRREMLRLLAAGLGAGLTGRVADGSSLGEQTRRSSRRITFPKGAIIRTILRDVDPESLGGGAVLTHEHISIYDPLPPWRPRPTQPTVPYAANIDLMVDEVKATAKDGVSCIVNPGTRDLGQNVEHLRAIASRSGVPIVITGGYHVQANYPPEIAQKTEDQLVEEFLRDAATERWGALGELGSSGNPMHPDERKVLRAACRVHLQTGLPILTHTPHSGCQPCGLEQLDIIESMRVDPRLVSIGHVSDITDDPKAETHKAIAKRGAFVAFDTVGRRIGQPDSKKLEMLLAVIDAGYEDHVLLGSDLRGQTN